MELWVLIAVMAAGFQTLRFALQKRLSIDRLSTLGAVFARFFYAVPLITPLALGYLWWRGATFPELGPGFWGYAISGGLAQILATWSVVTLFQQRNFAVGIAFKKTEVILTAIVGFALLGDTVSFAGFAAIVIGLIGVLLLSQKPATPSENRRAATAWTPRKTAGIGILSGVLFAFSAVGYRGATLEIAHQDALLRSSIALMVVTWGQTLGMLLWLRWREPGEISRVIATHRTALWTGITSTSGSLCWFTAFTLQNAAYVFAVGQIEVIFSIAASALLFKEVITGKELLGIAVISLSVIALVLIAHNS